MRFRAVLAVIPAAGLVLAAAPAATAHTTAHSPPPVVYGSVSPPHLPGMSRTCTAGHIDYGYSARGPSWIQEDWESNGCDQAISPHLITTNGHNDYGGWVTSVEVNSRASDLVQMATGIIRFRNSTTDVHCKQVYPSVGNWHTC